RITAGSVDIALAPDGSTPTALQARQSVQLTLPDEGGGRTILADAMDSRGDDRKGLTSAHFAGAVQFRERAADVERVAHSAARDVALTPGMATLDQATFMGGVRFEQSDLRATAATAHYLIPSGTLQLSGTGSSLPHLEDDQMMADASHFDVVLVGPRVKA